jgi:hypothetical protein
MAVVFFTPTGYVELITGSASSRVAIPGSPACIKVSNSGPNAVVVLVGTSTVVVTETTGLYLASGESIYLAAASSQYIAALALGPVAQSSSLYIAAGS